jgi:tetratricopeptide (TPR) repeat protein
MRDSVGQLKRALELLQSALDIAPNNGNVHFKAASIYWDNLSNAETAIKHLKLAIEYGFPAEQIMLTPSLSTLRQRTEFHTAISVARVRT